MKAALALALAVYACAVAVPALASEQRPTQSELESELICPTCETTLDQSDAPVARRMKEVIREYRAAGYTKSEIKDRLVADFGTAVLAAPPKRGFNLLAWVVPLLGVACGAVVVAILAWQWSRAREPAEREHAGTPELNGKARLEPELERRLDEELARFDA